jgi:hypothetical protein
MSGGDARPYCFVSGTHWVARTQEGRPSMSFGPKTREHRRFRLAANDNETIVEDDDTEGHRLAANDTEIVVDDGADDEQKDTEGHRLAANDTEIAVDDGVDDEKKDTEGHRLATNDSEITVESPR